MTKYLRTIKLYQVFEIHNVGPKNLENKWSVGIHCGDVVDT